MARWTPREKKRLNRSKARCSTCGERRVRPRTGAGDRAAARIRLFRERLERR